MSRSMKAAAALVLSASFVVPAAAQAKQPTPLHRHQYTRAYRMVARLDGSRAPGRNILKWGTSDGKPATDAEITISLQVLDRMLTPVSTSSSVSYTPVGWAQPVSHIAPVQSSTVPVPNGLVACIVSRESGGNSQAVNPNGHYGLGQWDIATWLSQGGGRYSSTPLGASYGQQLSIIESAVAHGQSGAWTPYDGC